ncbi:MAG: transcriptional repressor [Muribaculaceae bacterium]|nr:transcriptional repressor [Muribaculaceae bacterium]
MSNSDFENILTGNGIKPTANRILVLKELMRNSHPVNLADLETALAPIDKGSIFRVLQLFSEKEVIHVIEDGSRSLKYEVCHAEDHHTATDQHPHFYCEKCGELYCLDTISLPDIKLPDDFEVKSINLMIKGLCPKCIKNRDKVS